MAASKKGIGGLATGLDTDSIVEALLTGTRNKLAVQNQKKTKLNWQMTAYRSIATTLRNFQGKHISMSAGANSLKGTAFFNVFKGTSSSDAITVKPASGASTGTFTVEEVKQLATNHSYSTQFFKSELIGEEIDFDNNDFVGKTLVLSYGNDTKTIRLDTLQNKTTAADVQAELEILIDKAFGKIANPDYVDDITTPDQPEFLKLNVSVNAVEDEYNQPTGKYTIKLDGGTNVVTVKNTADGLGLTNGMSNRLDTGKTIKEVFGDELVGESFVFSLNGVEISLKASDSLATAMARINSSSAGVTVRFNTVNEKFVFSSKVTGAGNNLEMRDVQGNFLNLWAGAESGGRLTSIATGTNASQTGGVLNISNISDDDLSKYKMRMQYGTIIAAIYPDLTDYKDKITAGEMTREEAVIQSMNDKLENAYGKDCGMSFVMDADKKVSFVSTRNDLLTRLNDHEDPDAEKLLKLLGMEEKVNESITMGYEESVTGEALGSYTALLTSMAGAGEYTMKMTVAGVTKDVTISVTKAEADALKDEKSKEDFLAKKLNDALDVAFKDVPEAKKITFALEEGKIKITTGDDSIAFTVEDITIDPDDENPPSSLFAALKLGKGGALALSNTGAGQGTKLNDICNVAYLGSKISIKVGDDEKVFDFTRDTTLQDLMREVNDYFKKDIMKFENNRVVIDGGTLPIEVKDLENGLGTTSELVKALFGFAEYATSPATNTADLEAGQGKNALIKIDGQWIPSTTNSFTYNGVDFEVNAESADPIKITVSTDPDDVVEKIKNFIEEYNTLVEAVQTMLTESPVAGYEPLTDEQRAELTEDQIKQWETEAKKGLLRNDPTVSRIMTQMRNALYTKVSAAGLALYDIGITTETFSTSSSYTFSGKLQMDETGEKRLRNALEQNPDAVRVLFSDSKEGLATQLDNIINDAVRISSTNPGSLVNLAGSDSVTGDNTSSLSRQIDSIDKQIATLKTRLENEYDRYWRQFTALETAISKIDAQSGYLSSMFGNSSNQ